MTQMTPESEVRTQLEKILKSRYFCDASALANLLRFTVERTLTGDNGKLKEYVIATEVFSRSDSFDPKLDPIVRVQAGRLRSRLVRYYSSDGRTDQIVIRFPSRGYRPTIVKSPQEVPSIAVLPFVNMSEDRSFAFFADALAEETINSLAHLEGIKVAARTSSFRFRGDAQDLTRVGEALNVTTLLEGSVCKVADTIRITVQLIDISSGFHLWAERYERKLSDIFEIQEDIARTIVSHLRIGQSEKSFITNKPKNLEAYHLFLEGRFHLQHYTEGSLALAKDCLERAVSKEPDYASAWAGLADYYWQQAVLALSDPIEVWPAYKMATLRALDCDAELPEAHALWGAYLATVEYRWQEAARSFQRARKLNSRSVAVRNAYVQFYLRPLGRIEQALREIAEALDSDPLSPLLRWLNAYMLYFQRDYDGALKWCGRTREMEPNQYLSHWLEGMVYEAKQMLPDSIVAFQKALRLFEHPPSHRPAAILGSLGAAYAKSGRQEEAEKILSELQAQSAGSYVPATTLAAIQFGLGNTDRGFDFLYQAWEHREPPVVALKTHPTWDSIRNDGRYVSLLARMELL